jgi:hypothetical protein
MRMRGIRPGVLLVAWCCVPLAAGSAFGQPDSFDGDAERASRLLAALARRASSLRDSPVYMKAQWTDRAGDTVQVEDQVTSWDALGRSRVESRVTLSRAAGDGAESYQHHRVFDGQCSVELFFTDTSGRRSASAVVSEGDRVRGFLNKTRHPLLYAAKEVAQATIFAADHVPISLSHSTTADGLPRVSVYHDEMLVLAVEFDRNGCVVRGVKYAPSGIREEFTLEHALHEGIGWCAKSGVVRLLRQRADGSEHCARQTSTTALTHLGS